MFLFKSTGNRKQVAKNPYSDISVEDLSLSEFPSEQVEYNAETLGYFTDCYQPQAGVWGKPSV